MLRKSLFVLAACALLASPVLAAELTVDEIIAKNIEAKGGRAALDNVKSLKMSGRMTMGGGMEAPLTVELKRPNKARIEFTFQGMTGIQAYDGETGWFVMPFAGKPDPEKMSEDQLMQMEEQADIDGVLVDYAKKGHTVELAGKEDVDGTPAYKLTVTKKNGQIEHHFVDAEYFLELKVESKRDFQGTEVEMEAVMGDYKEVAGLMMAHSIDQRAKGAPAGQTITIEKIEINAEMPDSRFAMPEVEPAAATEGGE